MHPIFPVDNEGNFKFKPIGFIRLPENVPAKETYAETESEIVLHDEFAGCLNGIDEFSHIIVVYWLNRVRKYREQCRPQEREDVPLLGQLATR